MVSFQSNNTFCNSLEQNVTLVQNNNELSTLAVNTYPKRIQQFIKTAFKINTEEQRPFSYWDFSNITNANFRQIKHKLRDNIVRVTKTHPARYILKGVSIPENSHKVTLDRMSVGQNKLLVTYRGVRNLAKIVAASNPTKTKAMTALDAEDGNVEKAMAVLNENPSSSKGVWATIDKVLKSLKQASYQEFVLAINDNTKQQLLNEVIDTATTMKENIKELQKKEVYNR